MVIRGLVVATAVLVLLAGCGTAPEDELSASAAEWDQRFAEFLDEYGSPPEPAAPFTDEEALAALAGTDEEQWDSVLAAFPDAVRPSGEFVRWHTLEDDIDPDGELARCYAEHGVDTQLSGTSPAGTVMTISPLTAEEASGVFLCRVIAFPDRPVPRLTDEQLGYLWDYSAEFLVPCLIAHGGEQTPMISREDYIAQWPHQEWYPAWPSTDDEVVAEAIDADCPAEIG